MKIGKKIYYEKLSGNIICEIGERQGDVVETTEEQNFTMYSALQAYVPDQVGVIQLDFGQYSEQFMACFGYRIDTETHEIKFNFIPPEESIEVAQSVKIAELKNACNTEILAGFKYIKNNTTYLIGFDEQDQANLTQQMIFLSVSTEPIVWKVKGDSIFLELTKEEFLQLGLSAKQNKEALMQKYFTLSEQVQACTTLEEVEAISW